MGLVEVIAKLEGKLRPQMAKMPPNLFSMLYSNSRKQFLNGLTRDISKNPYDPFEEHGKILWDLKFASPIFNAAGMFKYGDGYHMVAAQGAGAFLAGTTTSIPREGNIKNGIVHPFMHYPSSGSASNWMGLPNEGHAVVAKRLSKIDKIEHCPVGISVSSAPELHGKEALVGLAEGMKLFEQANVDFIELNESCPNVKHDCDIDEASGLDKLLLERLEYLNEHVLSKRSRNMPVIVKFSNDTAPSDVPALIDALNNYNFDGINIGNTSTKYDEYKKQIDPADQKNYEYFISNFGGGLSGRLLNENSLHLSTVAAQYIQNKDWDREFHVIRTGGVETSADIEKSEQAGVALNQWFSGFFEEFSKSGHDLYRSILR